MKTDKELLQLAARAVGVNGEYTEHYCGEYCDYRNSGCGIETKAGELWNALNYDSDALRLAVDLDLDLMPMHGEYMAVLNVSGDAFEESYGNDKHAATRRAIVRAAAAIGETME